eukprot:scaffold83393_cov35-Prasinocladus_malaysianus.AAC.2
MNGKLGSPVAYPIFQANKMVGHHTCMLLCVQTCLGLVNLFTVSFRLPQAAVDWIVEISEMDFDVVLPASFDAPIFDGKQKFFKCFEYVLAWDNRGRSESVI